MTGGRVGAPPPPTPWGAHRHGEGGSGWTPPSNQMFSPPPTHAYGTGGKKRSQKGTLAQPMWGGETLNSYMNAYGHKGGRGWTRKVPPTSASTSSASQPTHQGGGEIHNLTGWAPRRRELNMTPPHPQNFSPRGNPCPNLGHKPRTPSPIGRGGGVKTFGLKGAYN